MFNLNDIKNDIVRQLTKYACNRYSVKKDEVEIKFKRDGSICIYIDTSNYFDNLDCKVSIKERIDNK